MKVRKRTWTWGGKKRSAWQVTFTDPTTGKRVQRNLEGVRTKADADEAAFDIYSALCKSARKGERVPTQAELYLSLKEFLAQDLDRPIKPRTRALERHRHKPIMAYFGETTAVSAIDLESLRKYQTKRPGKPVANSTINDELQVLRAAFNRALEEGRLARVPKFPKPLPERKSEQRDLLPVEIDAILRQLRILHPVDADCIEVLYRLGGLRPDELWTMTWKNVNFQRKTVKVESTKTGDGGDIDFRILPMSPEVVEIVKRQPRRTYTDLVFGVMPCERRGNHTNKGTKDGVPTFARSNINKKFKAAAAAAKIHDPDSLSVYNLRHSAATNAQADNNDVAYMLGHADPTMTARLYRHARKDRVEVGVLSLSPLPETPETCDKNVTRDSEK